MTRSRIAVISAETTKLHKQVMDFASSNKDAHVLFLSSFEPDNESVTTTGFGGMSPLHIAYLMATNPQLADLLLKGAKAYLENKNKK